MNGGSNSLKRATAQSWSSSFRFRNATNGPVSSRADLFPTVVCQMPFVGREIARGIRHHATRLLHDIVGGGPWPRGRQRGFQQLPRKRRLGHASFGRNRRQFRRQLVWQFQGDRCHRRRLPTDRHPNKRAVFRRQRRQTRKPPRPQADVPVKAVRSDRPFSKSPSTPWSDLFQTP